MTMLRYLLFAILAGVAALSQEGRTPAPAVALNQLQEDGPYVLWRGAEALVTRIHAGRVEQSRLARPYELTLDGLPNLRLDPAPFPAASSDLPAPTRIAAVSDIHGNLPGLVSLLMAHGVVGPTRAWTFGSGHLVVAGDVFDRGSQVTEVLWLLRSLEAQALVAGGRVHVLLGNHEVMALRGDARYLHPKYEALQGGLLHTDQQRLYGKDSELGRWLRSRSVLLKLGPFLFAHGGPSPALCAEEKDLERFNARFRSAMDEPGSLDLLGKSGPVWYRGLIPGVAKKAEASELEVETLLKAFGVQAIVVGHTTVGSIQSFHGGRVFGIDADLQKGHTGELWLWENGTIFRGLPDGSRKAL